MSQAHWMSQILLQLRRTLSHICSRLAVLKVLAPACSAACVSTAASERLCQLAGGSSSLWAPYQQDEVARRLPGRHHLAHALEAYEHSQGPLHVPPPVCQQQRRKGAHAILMICLQCTCVVGSFAPVCYCSCAGEDAPV